VEEMKTKMTVRESKVTQNLLAAIRAKAEVNRKIKANAARRAEFDVKWQRVQAEFAEFEVENVRIADERVALRSDAEKAEQDVKLALQATSNESLTLRLRSKLRSHFSENQE
jgi:hypothetical protein